MFPKPYAHGLLLPPLLSRRLVVVVHKKWDLSRAPLHTRTAGQKQDGCRPGDASIFNRVGGSTRRGQLMETLIWKWWRRLCGRAEPSGGLDGERGQSVRSEARVVGVIVIQQTGLWRVRRRDDHFQNYPRPPQISPLRGCRVLCVWWIVISSLCLSNAVRALFCLFSF